MKKYTKDEIIELVKKELISTYGKLNSTGYTTIGIINSALDDEK